MIIEVATITVKPDTHSDFEAAVVKATDVFKQAKGCQGLQLHRSIEDPDTYQLHIVWETLENHTVDFREGPLFPQWRELVSPFFVSPPSVVHLSAATKRFSF